MLIGRKRLLWNAIQGLACGRTSVVVNSNFWWSIWSLNLKRKRAAICFDCSSWRFNIFLDLYLEEFIHLLLILVQLLRLYYIEIINKVKTGGCPLNWFISFDPLPISLWSWPNISTIYSSRDVKIQGNVQRKRRPISLRNKYNSDVEVSSNNIELGRLSYHILYYYPFEQPLGNTFELRESRIGPLSSGAIAKVLKNNGHIKKLDLYGNGNISSFLLEWELFQLWSQYVQTISHVLDYLILTYYPCSLFQLWEMEVLSPW